MASFTATRNTSAEQEAARKTAKTANQQHEVLLRTENRELRTVFMAALSPRAWLPECVLDRGQRHFRVPVAEPDLYSGRPLPLYFLANLAARESGNPRPTRGCGERLRLEPEPRGRRRELRNPRLER